MSYLFMNIFDSRYIKDFPCGTSGKAPDCPCGRLKEMQVWSLDGEDPLKKEMATHSSILSWRIPWTEEPSGLQTTGSQRVRRLKPLSMQAWNIRIRWKNSNLFREYMYIFIFIYFWLCWVFIALCGLSLVGASRGYSLLWCVGCPLWWLLWQWSPASTCSMGAHQLWHAGSWVCRLQ